MRLETGKSTIQKEEITIRLLKGVDPDGKVTPIIRWEVLQMKLHRTLNE